jgi:hypothetical protein
MKINFVIGLTISLRSVVAENCSEACASPSGLTATKITGTSAKLNCDAVDGATGYAIRYRAVGTNELLRKSATTNSRKLSGLAPNTSYMWQVETFCDVVPPGLQQLFTTGSLKLADEQSTTLNVYPNPTSGQSRSTSHSVMKKPLLP